MTCGNKMGRPWTSDRQDAILAILKRGPATSFEMAQEMGIEPQQVRRSMYNLKRRGYVVKKPGPKMTGCGSRMTFCIWSIRSNVPLPTKKEFVHREQILEVLSKGPATAREVAQELGKPVKLVGDVMTSLKRAGKIGNKVSLRKCGPYMSGVTGSLWYVQPASRKKK